MKKIAIYGRTLHESSLSYLREVLDAAMELGASVALHKGIRNLLSSDEVVENEIGTFSNYKDLEGNADYLISIGGDGTLLNTVRLVRDSGVPVLGINVGRMGYLAGTHKEEIRQALQDLSEGNYSLDCRALLELQGSSRFDGFQAALNECTIHKRKAQAMVRINAWLDGKFLNSYWADGLIISTPTGSTGYSLSCGGPIVFPGTGNFVITPIAPHNLNVRPIIISDKSVVELEAEGREETFSLTLDSRVESIEPGERITLSRASFDFNLVHLHNQNYITTLREKLMWGIDTRNEPR